MGVGLRFGAGPFRVYIPLTGGRKRKKRRKSKYWTHRNCSIRHQSESAANRCRVGRDLTPSAQGGYAPAAPRTKATPKQVAFSAACLVVSAGAIYALAHDGPEASTRTAVVSRAGFVGTWPLTVDSGILACPERNMITLRVGDTVYALSFSAEHAGKYADKESIMAGPIVEGGAIGDGILALVLEGDKLC